MSESGTPRRGLKGSARLLLALTTLAPVLFVWSAAIWDKAPSRAVGVALLAVVLVSICLLLLRLASTKIQTQVLQITKPKRMDKEALAFLVTYALPLVAPAETAVKVIPLAIFMALVCLVVFQLQLIQINPLLALFGYHFYEFEEQDGDTALVISDCRSIPTSDTLAARRLGPGLYLHATT
jgi:hypothetical protein